jgi:hypothetical protein
MRLLLVILVLVCVRAGAATTYYVSPTGSALANGLTPATAWTMANAVNHENPNNVIANGDTIIMLDGVYSAL